MVVTGWWGEGPQGLEPVAAAGCGQFPGSPADRPGQTRHGERVDMMNRSVWSRILALLPTPLGLVWEVMVPITHLGIWLTHLECSLPASSRHSGSAPSRCRGHRVQRQPHPQGGVRWLQLSSLPSGHPPRAGVGSGPLFSLAMPMRQGGYFQRTGLGGNVIALNAFS